MPKKQIKSEDISDSENKSEERDSRSAEERSEKRKVGRPRKKPVDTGEVVEKRKRGRPKLDLMETYKRKIEKIVIFQTVLKEMTPMLCEKYGMDEQTLSELFPLSKIELV